MSQPEEIEVITQAQEYLRSKQLRKAQRLLVEYIKKNISAGYWRRASFLGLGPSAHSGHGSTRAWNLREWEPWRRAVEAGTDPRAGLEELSDEQVRLEESYLGLRTSRGVPEALVPAERRSEWVRAGWAMEAGGRVFLSPEGWLRLDALVATLPGGS